MLINYDEIYKKRDYRIKITSYFSETFRKRSHHFIVINETRANAQLFLNARKSWFFYAKRIKMQFFLMFLNCAFNIIIQL